MKTASSLTLGSDVTKNFTWKKTHYVGIIITFSIQPPLSVKYWHHVKTMFCRYYFHLMSYEIPCWIQLDTSSIDVCTLMIKNFQIQRWQLCHVTTFIVSNVKTFCDCGELENEVKVKLKTCHKRSYFYGSWVEI